MPTYNRPYMFELAAMVLTARERGDHDSVAYATAEANGVEPEQLDRAVATLARLQIADFATWIRHEYLIDGWLHGYLDTTVDSADPTLTTWMLGQLADAHYRTAQ